jgi:hypothetical protein
LAAFFFLAFFLTTTFSSAAAFGSAFTAVSPAGAGAAGAATAGAAGAGAGADSSAAWATRTGTINRPAANTNPATTLFTLFILVLPPFGNLLNGKQRKTFHEIIGKIYKAGGGWWEKVKSLLSRSINSSISL